MRFQLLVAIPLSTVLAAQGAVQPCSIAASGALADGASHRPIITPDGRWIAFCSAATNLVPQDTNGMADVFVRDRLTGAVELISVDDAGNQSDGHSWSTGISDDGRFVCFLSMASNLIAGDTNGTWDGFVRDRTNGTTQRVTVGVGGMQGNTNVDHVTLSGDGSTAVFATKTKMVPEDTNIYFDVFAHDLATGTVERVSVSSTGAQSNNNSYGPCVSADGRFVAFHSQANNLVPDDTNFVRDVFVHDRQTGTTERVSVSSTGGQSNAQSRYAACSADGSVIAFLSEAGNLVPNDTNGALDVFVHDRATGATERVSVSSAGGQGFSSISTIWTIAAVSADGRRVAFYSPLDGLDGPINARDDAFVHDRLTGTTTLATRSSTGEVGDGASGTLPQFGDDWVLAVPAIASDPPIAALSTVSGNLVPWDTNAVADVFAVDFGLRCTAAGPAFIGGAATVELAAPSYPDDLFVGMFGPSIDAGHFLPSSEWLPLDDLPMLERTRVGFTTDGNGDGGWSLPIPFDPELVGTVLYATALRLDLSGPAPTHPAIGNVVEFVIQ